MKKLYLFLFSLTFFSFLIFIFGNYFFWGQEKYINSYIENTYIDQGITEKKINKTENDLNIISESKEEKIKVILKSADKIDFKYYPSNFNIEILKYTNTLKIFLNSVYINNMVDNLKIELYKEKNDVRWKMKDYSIKIYWVNEIELPEFIAVTVHEFGHFVDLYFFKLGVFEDISNYFYSISWDWVKVIKPWLKQTDFVSGYAATNKYEDFAESFAYFILHNDDFFKKTEESDILKQKYRFFTKYLYRGKEFVWTTFSIEKEIKPYYRDITKIQFSLENFLEFLKKWV